MKIIAIDPGYDRVGIALLEKRENQRKEKILFSECFITQRSENISERIFQIGNRIHELIQEYQPDFLVTEKLFFAKNTKTALSVAEARGVILFQGKRNNLEIYEYTPNQIKVAVTGNGSSQKRDILFMVPKLVEIDERKRLDDELDAIAIGITFFASYKDIV